MRGKEEEEERGEKEGGKMGGRWRDDSLSIPMAKTIYFTVAHYTYHCTAILKYKHTAI